MSIEEEIVDRFDYKSLKELNRFHKDGLNHFYVYEADTGDKLFVHLQKEVMAWPKFEHEMNSLQQIRDTNTIYAPNAIGVFGDVDSSGAGLVTEYVTVDEETDWRLIGRDLAALHHSNYVTTKKEEKRQKWVGGRIQTDEGVIDEEPKEYFTKFGFVDPTLPAFYGRNEFVNVWHEDWVEFFSRYRLEPQFRRVIEFFADRDVIELWSGLQNQLSKFFDPLTAPIVPSLLHGDLDTEKVAVFSSTVPIDFDERDETEATEKVVKKSLCLEPVSFYGHSEFDLAKLKIHSKGDFPEEFYEEYHKKIKRQEGFQQRSKLYQLFFALNDYKENETLVKSLMRQLLE